MPGCDPPSNDCPYSWNPYFRDLSAEVMTLAGAGPAAAGPAYSATGELDPGMHTLGSGELYQQAFKSLAPLLDQAAYLQSLDPNLTRSDPRRHQWNGRQLLNRPLEQATLAVEAAALGTLTNPELALANGMELVQPYWALLEPLSFKVNQPAVRFGTSLVVMELVNHLCLLPIFQIKRYFGQVRPRVLNPTLVPQLQEPPHTSFPGGHACEAWAVAIVMARVRGVSSTALENVAREVAVRREKGGLHTPTDTEAGINLGTSIAEVLLAQLANPSQTHWRILCDRAAAEV